MACSAVVSCVPRASLRTSKSYADVLRSTSPSPPPPPTAVRRRVSAAATPLGRPPVKLPFSQLTLGRTEPPWNARAWSVKTCDVEGDVLRVRYPKGSGTFHSKGPHGGCNFKAEPHCLPATDVTLSYRVRFADNFEWSKGGKLPGLFIGHGSASGGEHSSKAASCRLMWLAKGKVIAYVYVPTGVHQSVSYGRAVHENRRYGDSLFHDARLSLKGGMDWNDIVVRVKLNGFEDGKPVPDGVVSISVNNKAATFTGVVWRRNPAVKIEHIAVTSFFGGSWKSPVNTYAEFKDFAIVA